MIAAVKKQTEDIRLERQRVKPDHGPLIVAALWPKNSENLGTLGRTCDAVGACLAVPSNSYATKAVRRGNTIGDKLCVHWIAEPDLWLMLQKQSGWRLIGLELAYNAIPLKDVEPAKSKTILISGHESNGIPDSAWSLLDEVIEIPMKGVGNSLNVAVAASLALYKMAGMS